MAEQKSFKERVKEEAIVNAKMFKEFFVDCEYLVCSEAFEKLLFVLCVSSKAGLHLPV